MVGKAKKNTKLKSGNASESSVSKNDLNKVGDSANANLQEEEGEEEAEPSYIVITINALENVIGRSLPTEITISVEFSNMHLGETPKLLCSEEGQLQINYECILTCFPKTSVGLDDLISHPVLFTLNECKTESLKRKSSSIKSKTSKKGSKEKKDIVTNTVVGKCTLDLLPLILGENRISQAILVEQNTDVPVQEQQAWPKLPRLYVTAATEYNLLEKSFVDSSNILFFTIESIYNIPTEITDKALYDAATIIPINKETNQTVYFRDGICTSDENVDEMKQWNGLNNIPSRCSYSNYFINKDLSSIRTNFQINLEKELKEVKRRIQWNTVRRCWLNADAVENLKAQLKKTRFWPLEVMAQEQKIGNKLKRDFPNHLAIYLDLGSLLFPNESSVHIACQVCTYCHEDMLQHCQHKQSLFLPNEEVEVLVINKESVKSEDSTAKESKKGRESRKSSKESKGKKKGANNQGFEKKQEDSSKRQKIPEDYPCLTLALHNEVNEPLFVIVEVELMKPLVEKKSDEQLSTEISNLIPKRKELPPKLMTAKLAEENYQRCIYVLTNKIAEEYEKYIELFKLPAHENKDFLEYIHETGSYSKLKGLLRGNVKSLIEENLNYQCRSDAKKFMQNFISSVYTFLVEEMHLVINLFSEEERISLDDDIVLTPVQKLYFATEAAEQENYEKANSLYLEIINDNNQDVDSWLNLAIYHLNQSNIEKAIECVREVLSIDIRNKLGLLLYSILLTFNNKNEEAELFFQALTSFYPRFSQGWLVYYLFYLQTDNFIGTDVTLETARRTESEELTENMLFNLTPMVWRKMELTNESIFLCTVRLLILLGAYELAEIALAQELAFIGQSVPYLYYLAVCHYQQKRYADAITHLNTASEIHEKEMHIYFALPPCTEYYLWSLLGHCYYRLGDKETAQIYYKLLYDSPDMPQNKHLENLRLGNNYLEGKDYNRAKEVFLKNCAVSPTPTSWLSLGITCYLSGHFCEAELALKEANVLDKCCAVTWGYLALVNMIFSKKEKADICYQMAMKLNLQDQDLLDMIENLQSSTVQLDKIELQ